MNILIKNMLDAFIGGVSYWAVGYALAYGETGDPDFPNRFCGQTYFFRLVRSDNHQKKRLEIINFILSVIA